MPVAVLCVDDEPAVPAAFRAFLGPKFHVTAAGGGDEALAVLAERGPFAVVVSDLHMAGMDGIRLLAAVRDRYPDTVRVLATGQPDLPHAIQAVNDGHVFRFLTKPVSPAALTAALTAAADQYRLVTAERELLDRTLRGCVQVLGEMLALANPAAFSRAVRVQGLMREMAADRPGGVGWEVEVAAVLSQLGYVAVPERVAAAVDRGQTLTPDDQAVVARTTGVAAEFVARIPRMERVVRVITGVGRSFEAADRADLPATAGWLRLANDFDALLARGIPRPQALALLTPHAARHDPLAFAALERVVGQGSQPVSRQVAVAALTPDMTLESDLYSAAGVFLLRHGNAITPTMKVRLETLAAWGDIPPTLRVLVPAAG